MQDRPTIDELLDVLGETLRDHVLPELAGGTQHEVRVADSLTGILRREVELGPAYEDTARRALGELCGHDGTIDELNAELAHRLRSSDGDPELERAAWPVLLELVRVKLAINKPGYDTFDFADELPTGGAGR